MTSGATVYLVDDDRAVRDSLALLLTQHGFAVETFESAEAFFAGFRRVPRGCAIVDIRMPNMSGLQLQVELLQRGIRLPVIILTGYGDISTAVGATKLGAVAFLTKPVTGKALVDAVDEALLVGERTAGDAEVGGGPSGDLSQLTTREREVTALVIQGLGNKDIARALGISFRTVEVHRSRVMQKTGAKNILELVRLTDAVAGASRALPSVVVQAPLPFAMLDRDLRYLAASPSWRIEFGAGRSDLVGLRHDEVCAYSTPSLVDAYRRALDGEFVRLREDRLIPSAGSTRSTQWTLGPWRDGVGTIGGLLISADHPS